MRIKNNLKGLRIDNLITKEWFSLINLDFEDSQLGDLAEMKDEIPRSFWQEKIKSGHIKFKQKKIKNSFIVEKSEIKFINFDKKNIIKSLNIFYSNILLPYPGRMKIVYSDKNILIVNKPSPLTVHPAHPLTRSQAREVSLADIFLFHQKIEDVKKSINTARNGIVHRLDKKTTGLIILAKNEQTEKYIKTLFKKRKVNKEYLAICKGAPSESKFSVESWIGKWRRDPRRIFSLPIDHDYPESEIINPKKSKTIVTLISSGSPNDLLKCKNRDHRAFCRCWFKKFPEAFKENQLYSLLKIDLITGRTHQIRVHLSGLGLPIVQDGLYGNRKDLAKPAHALHSSRIIFKDIDNREVKVANSRPLFI